jgi:hypothetical protein
MDYGIVQIDNSVYIPIALSDECNAVKCLDLLSGMKVAPATIPEYLQTLSCVVRKPICDVRKPSADVLKMVE